MNANILTHLLEDCEFERMQDFEPENVAGMDDYAAFVAWNARCVADLSDDDRAGLKGVCALLKKGTLKMVDMESCGEWTACGFYFNAKKELVIVHPR
jgi:hypothetical protein